MIVFLDTETRSFCDLTSRGGRAYCADPSTELLCGVAIVVQGEAADVYAWAPWPGPVGEWRSPPPREGAPWGCCTWHAPLLDSDAPPEPVLAALAAGAPLVAHNAHGFDRHVWTGLGLPHPPGGWWDSLDRVRRRGLPGALEKLGSRLYGQGKDGIGRRLMLQHSVPRARKGQAPQLLDPAGPALTAILRYCARDAMLLASVWLDEGLGDPHPDDPVLAAHERIDERGVPVDLDLVRRLAAAEAELADEALLRAQAHGAGGTLLRAPAALRAWLAKRGAELPDLTSAAVRDALARPDLPEIARDVLEARLAVARVTGGKLASIEATVTPEGRLHGTLAYAGAHTGRWAGRGPQPQNFPRAAEDADALDAEVLARSPVALRAAAAERGVRPAALLGSLLRAVVRAPRSKLLVTIDFASIEARGLLWAAGDEEGLDVYRRYDAGQGPDPYRVMASRIFGAAPAEITKTQRQAGKVAVLGAGYQASAGAIELYAAKAGIDLAAAGVTPEQVVDAWRDAHPRVAGRRTGKVLEREDGTEIVLRQGGLWKHLLGVVRRCVEHGQAGRAGRCEWLREGPHMVCVLPSGRPILYRDVRIDLLPSKWTVGVMRPTPCYSSPKGGRVALYGGILAENVVQALCRDLLAAALVRLEDAGLPVVLHVHDELVVEVGRAADLDRVRALTEVLPAWAAGLPIATDGGVGERWSK